MARTFVKVRFEAKICRPTGEPKALWAFLRLPQEESDKLPARSMVSVEGTFNGVEFWTTLLPDGDGGHWMKVEKALLAKSRAKPGDTVALEFVPMAKEPEPKVPADFKMALAGAGATALETWSSITPMARRDWIFWIVSGKKAETRAKRISVALDKMSKGNRRPCCFDRTGMYDKSLSAPVAADD
ncbi:MAG TPA: YdeI/OmpD-associated family protein [Fimbriimonadaceae bacterium]|nr:YdeI/OmpD-associated family protein [Fimbriimonadaceae bacterium]